jgi:threonine dehydratase
MVGGRSPLARDERLLRFSSPSGRARCSSFERHEAELEHLAVPLPQPGRRLRPILVGMQVPAADDAALGRFLAELGYPWVEERPTRPTGCSCRPERSPGVRP